MQSQLNESNLLAKEANDPRKKLGAWFSESNPTSNSNLACALYKACACARSFLARTRFLFSIAGKRVDLGASCQFQDGYYRANTHTRARAEGIERLVATHPWVDNLDLRIFLMGFDAAEEYCKNHLVRAEGTAESSYAQTKQLP